MLYMLKLVIGIIGAFLTVILKFEMLFGPTRTQLFTDSIGESSRYTQMVEKLLTKPLGYNYPMYKFL